MLGHIFLCCLVYLGGYAVNGQIGMGFNCGALANLADPNLNIFQSSSRCYIHPSLASPIQPTSGFFYDVTQVPLLIRDSYVFASTGLEASKMYRANALPNRNFGVDVVSYRRPLAERTTYNVNVAISYALLRVADARLPWDKDFHASRFSFLFGLDPNDQSTDMTSPVGLGNYVGYKMRDYIYNDGFNQLGDKDCNRYGNPNHPSTYTRKENRGNFSDYTCYEPANTDARFKYPNSWQPGIDFVGNSTWYAQRFTNPYAMYAPTFAPHDVDYFVNSCPGPYKHPKGEYTDQAQELIDMSASLTDIQKMEIEFFNNKSSALQATTQHFIIQGITDHVFAPTPSLIIKTAAFTTGLYYDAMVLVWKIKNIYDAPRPFSVIKYLFEDQNINAWSQNRGTKQMKGVEWEPYLKTGSFSEYISTTTCINYALTRGLALLRGNGTPNVTNWDYTITFPQGSSLIEGGLTPRTTVNVTYATLDDHALHASLSRMWGGVHFRKASEDPRVACQKLADEFYAQWVHDMNGDPLLM